MTEMKFRIAPSSDRAKQDSPNRFAKKHEFPFADLTVGMSFEVPDGVVSVNTLRAAAVREGKKLRRIFSVIKHPGCYEVAYIGDREAETPKERNFLEGVPQHLIDESNRMLANNPFVSGGEQKPFTPPLDDDGKPMKPLWGPGSE